MGGKGPGDDGALFKAWGCPLSAVLMLGVLAVPCLVGWLLT